MDNGDSNYFYLLLCESTEEVKKENDILNNTEKAESAELEYQTLDEIRKTSADTLATNTTNVTVNKLIIGNGDVMPANKVLPYNNILICSNPW